jgi:hypothetical protein
MLYTAGAPPTTITRAARAFQASVFAIEMQLDCAIVRFCFSISFSSFSAPKFQRILVLWRRLTSKRCPSEGGLTKS